MKPNPLLSVAVHCEYLLILFLGVLVELAAGRALPPNAEMKSIVEDLHGALEKYNSYLKEDVRHEPLRRPHNTLFE